jgi:hypothetical protein
MSFSDDIIEDETENDGGHNIDCGCRRHILHGIEENRHIDVLGPRVREPFCKEEWNHRCNSTDTEKVQQWMIHLSGAEHVGGSGRIDTQHMEATCKMLKSNCGISRYDTPDDGGGPKRGSTRTDETIVLAA